MNVELKIDEDFLSHLHKQLMGLSEYIERQSEILIDKNEDIFLRYITCSRMKSIILAYNLVMSVACDSFISGHNINHPFLQTEKLKENSWDKIILEEDEFFITEEKEKYREKINKISKSFSGVSDNE